MPLDPIHIQIYFKLISKKGNPPIHDSPHKSRDPNNKREQLPHYHPANKDGTKKDDGSHYQYPKKQGK